MASITQKTARALKSSYPWTTAPLIVGAPMRIISGPALAVAISSAGGLGFIGPGAKPVDLELALSEAKDILSKSPLSASSSSGGVLPIGVGFQTWAGDIKIASPIIQTYRPVAAWLFAPRHGQSELDEWARSIRAASHQTQIWIQVASVSDALNAATSPERPDVLVIQGTDAGGHSLTKGASIITLLPEVFDALSATSGAAAPIPLVAAGGILDGRGVAAALTLGAAGAAMGTRFLAAREARISGGYQRHVLQASDGGQTTVRTQLYNHLRGTMDWPAGFDARGLANASWRDHKAGVPFERNRELYGEASRLGDDGWGEEGRMATYAGTGVGLVREVRGAAEIVGEVWQGAGRAVRAVGEGVEGL